MVLTPPLEVAGVARRMGCCRRIESGVTEKSNNSAQFVWVA